MAKQLKDKLRRILKINAINKKAVVEKAVEKNVPVIEPAPKKSVVQPKIANPKPNNSFLGKSIVIEEKKPISKQVEKPARIGRPTGSGKYGELTRAVRLPISMVEKVENFVKRKALTFPLYNNDIASGYSSPADDIPALSFDLGAHIISNPAATFFLRVSGDSMTGAGIFDRDLLVVDKSVYPKDEDIVVAAINGEFTVKRLSLKNSKNIALCSENPKFKTISIDSEDDLSIWGVVRYVIKQV